MFNRWKKRISAVAPYTSGSANPFDHDPYADLPGVEITGPWHPKMAAHVKDNTIRRVHLNAVGGFTCPDFGFLAELDHLQALSLSLIEKPATPVPLETVSALQQVRVTQHPLGAPVDFARMPNLRSCSLVWSPSIRSIFGCTHLERLSLRGLPAGEVEGLTALAHLKNLQLANTSLSSLAPLAGHTDLERLDLVVARKLESLEAVSDLTALRCLYLAEAHKISSLEPLQSLTNLEALIIVDCGEIESLAPLANLNTLKAVSFAGTKTTIRDGDLSPLTGLPNLAMLMFGPRRHYSHKLIKKWNWDNFNHPDALLTAA